MDKIEEKIKKDMATEGRIMVILLSLLVITFVFYLGIMAFGN